MFEADGGWVGAFGVFDAGKSIVVGVGDNQIRAFAHDVLGVGVFVGESGGVEGLEVN